jgi:DNA-binding transcriptional ArsR family regulator
MEHKTRDLRGKVLELLEGGPLTPDEVAHELGISWGTAQSRLLGMVAEGKVRVLRKGRVNLYSLRQGERLHVAAPPWARVKPLEALAEELKQCFRPKISAAEMIRKERNRA